MASPALAQATRTTKSAIVRLAVCLVLVARVSALAAPPQYGLPVGNDGIPPRHTISSAHQIDGCAPAIARAELRYRLPPGLLMAIGNVESGRRSTDGRTVQPWPWTVNASGEGRYFDGMTEATTWVQERQSAGVLSIDVGCMQVNLLQHPDAFKSLASAFDPTTNADYAARFLLSLYQKTGDWMTAAGFYHSQTTDIAEPYRRLVLANYHGVAPSRCLQPAAALRRAWEATLVAKDGDGLASSDGPGALWRPLGVTQGSRSEGDALAGRAAPANRSGARPFVSTNSFAVGHQRCSDSAIVPPDKRSRPGSRPNQTVLVSR